MKSIWRLFLELCLFRRGPDQVPASSWLLFAVALSFVLFNVVVRVLMMHAEFVQALLSSVLVLSMFGVGIWLALAFKGLLNRFQQTFTAILGQDLVISILSLPLIVVMARQDGGQGALLQVGMVLLFAIYGWDLTVKGFVFRNALGVSPGLAFMFAFSLVIGTIAVENQLFGKIENVEREGSSVQIESTAPIEAVGGK